MIIKIIKLAKFFLGTFIKPFIILFFKIYNRKTDKLKPLPATYDSLLFLPAHKLARKIRNKEITSTQLVDAYIKRIKEIRPYVNCVTEECFEKALEQAKYVDKILSSDTISQRFDEHHAPLLGVPFSCKESLWIEGMLNTTGLIARKDFRAPKDSDVVRNMREAGAILLCTTNTSELCMWLESSNRLFGITRNPYNLSRIVGGSSGGEACLIASTGSVIGIGSDIGGSIRMPCFFNGIYGHKPSSHIISNDTSHPPAVGIQKDMLVTGPMCRYASDLRLMFKILAGPNIYSQFARNFETKIELTKLNYYVIPSMDNLLTTNISKSTKQALDKAVEFVEEFLNVKVKKLNLKKFKLAYNIWTAGMNNGEASSNEFSKLMTDNSETYKLNPFIKFVKWLFSKSNHTLPAIGLAMVERIPLKDPKKFIQIGEKLKEELNAVLGENSVLLCPGFTIPAPYHGQPFLTNTFDFIYFGIWNSMGFPVTQCPMGLCPKSGLPVGIQIVSNKNCDHLTIRLAEFFEDNLIGWVAPFN